MTHFSLAYTVGALLYCPANNTTIVNSITHEKFGKHFPWHYALRIPSRMAMWKRRNKSSSARSRLSTPAAGNAPSTFRNFYPRADAAAD